MVSSKLVFMGTPSFALPALKSLHEAGHEIVAVYTQPPRPAGRGQREALSVVHEYALEHQIPVHTPVSLKSPEAQAEFAGHKADAAIVAAYGLLLPQPILDAYPLGCINIHPSLLPRWRGAAPIQRTVMAGDRETGICIMQMDAGLDTGDVLALEHFTIPDGMNAGDLHHTLSEKSAPLMLATLEKLQAGKITRITARRSKYFKPRSITQLQPFPPEPRRIIISASPAIPARYFQRLYSAQAKNASMSRNS